MLRTLTICVLISLGTTLSGGDELTQFFAKNPVWILDGLKWEKDPGEPGQMYSGGTGLLFKNNGEFGMFSGTILRHAGRLALATGEGQIVYAGRWTNGDGAVQIKYRLTSADKLVRPKGEKPPEIPGPLLHAEIQPKQRLIGKEITIYLELEQRRYVATSKFDVSGLVEQLHHLMENRSPQS